MLISTAGKKLVLTIGASPSSQGSDVTVGLAQGTESHVWSFRARASDLGIGSTGAGTLKLPDSQTGTRGRLDLRFSPTDTARTRSCGGKVASRTRPMAVSGIAWFKSGASPWGNVGSATRTTSSTAASMVGMSGSTSGSTASITAHRSRPSPGAGPRRPCSPRWARAA
ncbi:hypothetical protein [Nocardioides marmoribigeumensis]|uniref:Uncharacterized protein n=1 Tax=Nocardioides marmoribigeumensis TaxID=433649 RepID=A0ABU2BSA1_9ACTN|nr:hypothetical protein [Nocardioides marmoribigeumensis]MDR7361503.1 hypothetical protein [Nocardioides marmoribigeumensis]